MMITESGTEVWERLEVLEDILDGSPPCDELMSIMDEAVEIYWSAIRKYPSEGIKAWDVMLAAIIQYAENCSPPTVTLSCNIEPNFDYGAINIDILDPHAISGFAEAEIFLVGALLALFATMLASFIGVIIEPLIALVIGGFGLETLLQIYDMFFTGYWESTYPDFTCPPVFGGAYNAGQVINFNISVSEGRKLVRTELVGSELVELSPDGKTGKIFLLENSTLTAYFDLLPWELRTESFTDRPEKGGTIQPAGTTYHAPYSVVQIYANPNQGFRFEKWGKDAAALPPESPIDFTMMHDKSLVVGYFLKTWEVSIDIVGNGQVSPPGGIFDDGYEATFTAIPDEGFLFIDWTGDLVSANPIINLTIDSDKGLIATFEQGFTLTTSSEPIEGGSVIPTGEHLFPKGTEVTLTVNPNEGYRFDYFLGDVIVNPGGGYSIVLDEDKTVVANFMKVYNLVTVAVPGDAGVVAPSGTTIHDENTEVVLTASPEPLHHFRTWSGDLVSSENPVTIVMDGDKSIVAEFDDPVTLTLTPAPLSGGTVFPPGESFHALETEVNISAAPFDGFFWGYWSGDISSSEALTSIIMDADKEAVGNFIEAFKLTVYASPVDGGLVSPAGESYHPAGSEVRVSAQSAEGFIFDHWEGDVSETNPQVTIIMDSDKEILGVFVEASKVTITSSDGGITSPSGEVIVKRDSTIIISAISDVEYYFHEWTGDTSGSANPLSFGTSEAEHQINAVFKEKYSLVTGIDPLESGSVSPSGETYHIPDSEVLISAIETAEWNFLLWSGDVTGIDNPYTLVMDDNKVVTGHFIRRFKLTTEVIGDGAISVPPESYYPEGTEIEIYYAASDGWIFDEWQGDYPGGMLDNPLVFIIEKDTTVTAIFKIKRTLVTSVSPGMDSGSVSPPGTSYYPDGDIAACLAQSAKGWVFSYWDGTAEIHSNPLFLEMVEDKAITAHFLKTYHLITKITPTGGGMTTPDDGDYLPGTVVHVYPNAATGYTFVYWSGDFTGLSVPAVLVMNSDRSVTAHFSRV